MSLKNGGKKKARIMLDDLMILLFKVSNFINAKNFVEQYNAREELKITLDKINEKYPDLEIEP